MGTSLTGVNISSSYLGLLKSTDSLAISTSAKRITDGAGNDLPIKLSTNQMLFNAGTASAPALSFDGNLSEGFFLPTDENIGVAIAGSEVARFLSTGLSLTSSKLTLSNDQKVRWTSDDVYIQGTTASDNIQLGVGGSTQFTFAQTTGMRLHQYGSGNITGTVTQRLGVTSAGQVVEIPIGAGALDGSGTAGKIAKFTDSDTLGDSVISESSGNIQIQGLLGVGLVPESAVQLSVNGQIGTSNNGNAGAPDFTFYGDDNTGMFRADADTLAFSTGGTERLRVNSTGLGIGTTSPASKAHVAFTADFDGLRIQNSTRGHNYLLSTAGTSAEVFSIYDLDNSNNLAQFGNSGISLYTGGTERLNINSSGDATFAGNVTINKASNPTSLQIGSSLADDPFIVFQTDGNTMSMGIDRSDSNKFVISDNATLGTNNRLTIDTSGNSTFAGDVTISGSGDKIISAISSDDDATLFLSGAGSGKDTHIVYGGDRDLFISKSSSATATSEGTPVLTLGSNSNATFAGDVTISKDVPAIDFVDTNSDDDFRLRNNNGTFEVFDTTNTGARFQVNSDGNSIVTGSLGIGATPSEDLHITGDTPVIRLTDSDTSRDAQIVAVDGNLRFDADNSDAQSSTNISFRTDGGEAMRIDASRRLGIGTTSPSNGKLQIDNSTNQISIETGTAGDGRLHIGHFSNGTFIGTYGDDGGVADLLRFGVHSGDTALTINSDLSATFAGDISLTQANTPTIELKDTTNNQFLLVRHNNSAAIFDVHTNSSYEFQVNSSTKMILANNGKLGLGTTSPSRNLSIVSDSFYSLELQGSNAYNNLVDTGIVFSAKYNSSGQITDVASIRGGRSSTADGNFGGDLKFFTRVNGGSDTERLKIDSSGGVIFKGALADHQTNAGAFEYFSNQFKMRAYGASTGTGFLTFDTGGGGGGASSERMRLDSSGNLGLGTTNATPSNGGGMCINGGSITRIDLRNSTTGDTTGDGTSLQLNGNDFTIENRESGYVAISTSLTERMRITTTGEITLSNSDGIRLSPQNSNLYSADGALSYYGTDNAVYLNGAGANGWLRLQGSGAENNRNAINIFSSGYSLADTIEFITASSSRARIKSDGSFLINTTSNSQDGCLRIDFNDAASSPLNAGIQMTAGRTNSSNQMIFGNPNGTVGTIQTLNSATSYNTSSDYRLKEDLKDFNALDIASKIKMYDFKWKAGDSRSYGVMAHELQEVVPQAVSGDKDAEDMQQVDYSKLVPILLKSIQELEARVKELEKEI